MILRLMLIDTSTQPIGTNAQSVFDNINQDYIRIQLSELEESRIDWSSYMSDGTVRLHPKKNSRSSNQSIEGSSRRTGRR